MGGQDPLGQGGAGAGQREKKERCRSSAHVRRSIAAESLPLGVRLVAELHQQGASDLSGRPRLLLRELLPPAPDLSFPEGTAHSEDVLLHGARSEEHTSELQSRQYL